METWFYYFFRRLVIFSGYVIGVINNPYITYRKLSDAKSSRSHIFFIFFGVLVYFTLVSLIRSGIRNPYLLTYKFNLLTGAFLCGFAGFISVFYLSGMFFRKNPSLKVLTVLWSYSLLPTIFWFFLTSLLYIVIPPPRTFSIPGKIFTIFFTASSIALAIWKAILYYLTLRFGMKFDLARIVFTTIFIIPLIILYSFKMYQWGIFRIPFI
ncbi:hypothetical protein A3D03_01235 [Candidatus Gottesmanbacteria bacterium RIFCSPHIGHO2_02_FULL_40_13]|uniref:Yip1 domain-containing protein n=1 Tax=Candidatus Gottesmanbacteria bacterium RIFCSPHIGHO2_02_FULL_40_13 TaxID=1798384 RepID=A0A1F6A779_9BACT|nr:MAG: hypothetical protein A3D03_01235 [Candidatus Gottesmanbacteria bacterium RIFCSPHIGHO2_02_FULL_40_13]